jgi:hypothetical protein
MGLPNERYQMSGDTGAKPPPRRPKFAEDQTLPEARGLPEIIQKIRAARASRAHGAPRILARRHFLMRSPHG